MAGVYGIDLGTTFSSCAWIEEVGSDHAIALDVDGDAKALASEVLLVRQHAGIVAYVGTEARRQLTQLDGQAHVFVQHAKRAIGVPPDDDRYRQWRLGDEVFDAIDISALILKKLKQQVEAQGEGLGPTIITHPRDFIVQRKHATAEAARAVGIDLLQTIDEPVAAFHAFCPPNGVGLEAGTYVVFDLGGGTLDIAVLDVAHNPTTIRVVDGDGAPMLGGVDWDEKMFVLVLGSLSAQLGKTIGEGDLDLRTSRELRVLANTFKHRGNQTIHQRLVEIGFSVGGPREPQTITVNRDAWTAACGSLVASALDKLELALANAGKHPHDIKYVLPVGGSTRLQMIREALNARFPSRVLDPSDYDVDVALAIAVGAARYGSQQLATKAGAGNTLASVKLQVPSIKTSLARGLCVKVVDADDHDALAALVERGNPLPCQVQQHFEIAQAGTRFSVDLYESDPGPLYDGVKPAYSVPMPSSLRAVRGDAIQIHVAIGPAGRLERASVEHLRTGHVETVTLKNPERALDEDQALARRRERLQRIRVI